MFLLKDLMYLNCTITIQLHILTKTAINFHHKILFSLFEKKKKQNHHSLENLYSLTPPPVPLWKQIYGVGRNRTLLKLGKKEKSESFPDLQRCLASLN